MSKDGKPWPLLHTVAMQRLTDPVTPNPTDHHTTNYRIHATRTEKRAFSAFTKFQLALLRVLSYDDQKGGGAWTGLSCNPKKAD